MKIRGIDRKLTNVLPDLSVAHYLQNCRVGVDGELRWRRGMAKSSIAVQSGPVVAQGATNNRLGPFIAMQVGTTLEGLSSGAALWGDVSLQAPTIAINSAGTVTLTRATLYARSFLLYSSSNRGAGPIVPLGEFTILPHQTSITTTVTDLTSYYAAEEKAGSIIGPRCAWTPLLAFGVTWTYRVSVADVPWYVTYGGGQFVAVSGLGTGVMTSPDGITWTLRTGNAGAWGSIAYGAGRYVALSITGAANNIQTSTDGITWVLATDPHPNVGWDSYKSIVYGGGQFVAVSGLGSVNNIMTSPDGLVWTNQTKPTNDQLLSVGYGNGVYVAIANGGGGVCFTSTDAVTWTQQTLPPATTWLSITHSGGLFVAVNTNSSTTTAVATSPDGVTWTARTIPALGALRAVLYANGTFVAVGLNQVFTSPDGITWTQRTAKNNLWISLAYGSGLFAATSSSGTGNRVMTSP